MAQAEDTEVDIVRLQDVGRRLSHPSSSKDSLLQTLKEAFELFVGIDQVPKNSVLQALKPSMDALVQPVLLKHKDKDVQLLVASCISEIMRIVAPDAPFSDEILKEMFELIVASFKGLGDIGTPSFDRRVKILETVASVRSCIVMLDIECDDLILEMFQIFFATVREDAENVMAAMKKIMVLVLIESEEIPAPLLEVLLSHMTHKKGVTRHAAYVLAGAVFTLCANELEKSVEEFLASIFSESKSQKNKWRENLHDIIYEIYIRVPKMIYPLIPKLIEDLMSDKIEVRIRMVTLLGRLFASNKGVADNFRPLFIEYLKRFNDRAVEVRKAVVESSTHCLLAYPSGGIAEEILAALSSRLQDFDNSVRIQVVNAICDYVKENPEHLPNDVLKRVAERLRDTEMSVRRETLQKLTVVYRVLCLKSFDTLESFDWIPSKLIRCCFDKDCKEFKAQAMELIFSEQLFPRGFSVDERVKCWISFFSAFDDNDVKALERILMQKQRLHNEMQNYLFYRQKLKDDKSIEYERKLQESCRIMSHSFVDPVNAESELLQLSQLKDNKVLKELGELLDPELPIKQIASVRENLLERIGQQHPRHEFLKVLAAKCCFLLFNKEHVKSLISEIYELKKLGEEKEKYLQASMALLVVFANHFPGLLEGAEEKIMDLLMDDKEFLKEGALQILAKIGCSLRGQLSEESNSVELLEKLCIEGSRKQVKYAVQALAAVSNDSGQKVFAALYRKLLDLLDSGVNLPTVLQSLGIIAQHAFSVFETSEDVLVNFLVQDLFRRDSSVNEDEKTNDSNASETTLLKIYGLKTLVRSFLPNKDVQHFQRLKGLIGILEKFLKCGEVTDEIKSSPYDKDQLRLAAAKGVLRLSKRYDSQISPQMFQSVVLLAQDSSDHVRQHILVKIQKLLKERCIPQMYACAFVLSIGATTGNDVITEAKQQLADFVEASRRQARFQSEMPENILFYLVHTLASQAKFPSVSEGGPDAETVEPFFKQLSLCIWALLYHDVEEAKQEHVKSISSILSVFRAMKNAEDVIDDSKTENSYVLCDIGIAITKDVAGSEMPSSEDMEIFPLPNSIYKHLDTEPDKQKVDGSHLPPFLKEKDSFLKMKSTIPFLSEMGTMHPQKKRKADKTTFENDKPVPKKNKGSDMCPAEEDQELKPVSVERRPGMGRKRSHPEKAKTSENDINMERQDTTVPSSPKMKRGVRTPKEVDDIRKVETGESHKEEDENKSKHVAEDSRRKESTDLPKRVSDESRKRISEDPRKVVNEDSRKHAAARNSKEASTVDDGTNQDDAAPSEMTSGDTESTAPGTGGSAKRRVRISIKTPKPPQEPSSYSKQEVSSETKKGRPSKKDMDAAQDDVNDNGEVLKSPRGTPRRSAKKMKISGLESPDSRVDKDDDPFKKVGRRVRVWWPLDKTYYHGTIEKYDPKAKTHKVLYDDGDIEHLKLEKERWDYLDDTTDDVGSPSTPAPNEFGSKLKKKDNKVQNRRGSRGGSASKSLSRSPKGRKPMKGRTSVTPAKHSETEHSEPSYVSDTADDLHDGYKTPSTGHKGRPKGGAKRSEKKLSGTGKFKGIKSSETKSYAQSPEGNVSPAESMESKDSDDVPLDEWKTSRKKIH